MVKLSKVQARLTAISILDDGTAMVDCVESSGVLGDMLLVILQILLQAKLAEVPRDDVEDMQIFCAC